MFLDAHQKIHHITHDPLDVKDFLYDDWFANVCGVISWLANSMEEQIARGVLMLTPAKKIWNTLKSIYGYEKNISCVIEIYKHFFSLQ